MILLSIIFFVIVGIFLLKNREHNTHEESNLTNTFESGPIQGLSFKSIHEFQIMGINHSPESYEQTDRFFIGYVQIIKNVHDKYAIGVYNLNNRRIGYLPRGNKHLQGYLKNSCNGRILCWGELKWSNTFNHWSHLDSMVKVPQGFDNQEINLIDQFLKLKLRNIEIWAKKEIQTEDYFNFIDNYNRIQELLRTLPEKVELNYKLPSRLIPSFSKKLEHDKNWIGLIELGKHSEIIALLDKRYINATITRIELAKEILNIKDKVHNIKSN